MAIAHVKTDEFDAFTAEGMTLIDFWATWCGPCRMQAPILEKLDAELGEKVKIGKVDVDEEPGLARRFRIMSIPTLACFKDGQLCDMRVGLQNLDQLKQMLEK